MKEQLRLTKVTRKGQVTIPDDIRDAFGIAEGDFMMVHGANGVVVLKKLSTRNWSELFEYGQKFAHRRGINREQILNAVREIRRGR